MHPLLRRQAKKYLGRTDGFPDDLARLLAAVDDAYRQSDEDRSMLEHSTELSSRELVARNTELTSANERLSESLRRLGELQDQLLYASRRAGMADVATTVLHNVGNVLNSVNVSAALVSDLIRRSKVAGLSKAAVMIREHEADRAAFLAHDARGRLLPEYVCKVADAAIEERAAMLSELEAMQSNIDHIKVIVGMQQSHARAGGLVETLALADLLEDALRFDCGSYERHRIAIAREFAGPGKVTTDRHRVLQILLNLLSNARQAVKAGDAGGARIAVRTRATSPGRFAIEVEDNGVGISPENLTRIFAHGFTTRREGHGFGLHGSACAALELGGRITVTSEGPGRGACFTLELPGSEEPG